MSDSDDPKTEEKITEEDITRDIEEKLYKAF